MLGFITYLTFLTLRGSTFRSGIPSVDLIFECEQVAIMLVGLSYFHLVFFHQENFLRFFNLVKQGSNDNSNTGKPWRKLIGSYLIFVVGLVWLMCFNMGRILISGTLKQQAHHKWHFFIEGVHNFSKLEELETWKLGVGLLFELIEWDVMNMAIYSIAFVYFVAVTICKTVIHLTKAIENMNKYLAISSEAVIFLN